MMTADPLALLRGLLQRGPVSRDRLLSELEPLWIKLGWQTAQASLWLSCLPLVSICYLQGGEIGYALSDSAPSATNSLADELVALVRVAGRPIPVAQLLSKLPAGRLVTEPLLRAIAQQDPRLELKGPFVKLTD